ncbi:MAG TPA: O-succinylhomoserine sulfhydrylase [Thiolapillus brandeum]|uniref:O-succinylhomoserine sulfhydrylase n=1 Tax=Thiolapillus brandeum TaxID=1076588 RepID=A0A831JSG0_9GAMM|nr:O-succinylhomoserine sulfhydrylase [Thiolapillus brandeum]
MTEDKSFIRPCTRIYLLLMGLTLVTWFIGVQHLSGLQISLIVLGIALLKGQLIGDYFMGLKQVSSFWRWVVTIWLLLPGSLITYAFYIST